MHKPIASKDRGQSIIILVLFFFFVFLAFAALAVDGTNIYLRRRQLQNMADAAALAAAQQLAQTQDVTAAYQIAMNSIAVNHGRVEWYSASETPNPPTTNVGTGVGLTMGIEITGRCDVRVALVWGDIGTYFAQFVGQETLQVGANAHAGCNRAGGLQPIAVKRFGDERDWNLNLTNTNDATVYCDDCSTGQSLPPQGLGNATEFLRPATADLITQWPPGAEMYAPPSPHADMASGAPGREYFFLGANTDPNVGTVSYAGLVNLDIRHVAAPPVEYYNGVAGGTNPDTLKYLGEYYIRHGYCCDIPDVGNQVAMYNGGSTAFAAQALQQTYAVGDIIAVIVYNGHVFNSPSLTVAGSDPYYRITHPTTATVASTVLTYTIDLEATNGFQSAVGGVTMNVQGLTGFATWDLLPTSSPVIGRNGVNERTLTLVITPTWTGMLTPTQVVTGTRMFYVSAIDDKLGGTGLRRYWAGIVSVGDKVGATERDLPTVTGTPTNAGQTYPFVSVVKGQQAKYQIQLDLWGATVNKTVTITSGALPTGFEWVSAPPWTASTRYNTHPGGSQTINIKVNDTAVASATPYVIPLTVSAPGMASQTFDLYVIVEETQTTAKEYVEILGYAALEILGYYNSGNPVGPGQPANAVRGRIVSRLMSDPSDLILGLRARLIPWN